MLTFNQLVFDRKRIEIISFVLPFVKPFIHRGFMQRKKEFSIMKWVFFPALTLALGFIVAYVNIKVFGWDNGGVYVVLLAVIVGFSIAITRYHSSDNKRLAQAAFFCEIFLVLSLIGNAAYSLYVMRTMTIADHATAESAQTLDTISKLKSRRAQDRAVSKMGEIKSSAQTFKEHEFYLLCLFILECVIYAVSLFVLVGLAQIWSVDEVMEAKAPSNWRDTKEAKPEEEAPKRTMNMARVPGTDGQMRDLMMPIDDLKNAEYLEADWREASIRPDQSRAAFKNPVATEPEKNDRATEHKSPVATKNDDLKRLREALKIISSERPGEWFKVDREGDVIYIRLMSNAAGNGEKTVKTLRADAAAVLADIRELDDKTFMARVREQLKRKEII